MHPKPPPPDCNLNLTCRQIAAIHGVGVSLAWRWKKAAGVPMRRGGKGIHQYSLRLWGMLSRADWEKGYPNVGRLMGVTPQAAHQMRKRLVKQGHDIPKRTAKSAKPLSAEE